MEYCSNQKSKTISNNDIARFPTVSADRPHGEWVRAHVGTIAEGYYCSRCGKHGYQTDFCPNCGKRMKGGEDE